MELELETVTPVSPVAATSLVSAQAPASAAALALREDSPISMALAAISKGMTPADLRELLAIQREWQADQARNAFNEALSAFRAEGVVTVAKLAHVHYETRDGSVVNYRHAKLSDMVDAVTPALSLHGLSFRWDVKQGQQWVDVTCTLKHRLGHAESCSMGGPPDQSGKKNAIQQIASTVTYLQRYTLKALLGISERDDDDDGSGGGPPPPATEGRPALPAYSEKAFDENLPKWRESIAKGEKTAERVIAFLSSRATLSEEQMDAIRGATAA